MTGVTRIALSAYIIADAVLDWFTACPGQLCALQALSLKAYNNFHSFFPTPLSQLYTYMCMYICPCIILYMSIGKHMGLHVVYTHVHVHRDRWVAMSMTVFFSCNM